MGPRFYISILVSLVLLLAPNVYAGGPQIGTAVYSLDNGTEVAEECIGKSPQNIARWSAVLEKTNRQIAACSKRYGLTNLMEVVKFLKRARIFCVPDDVVLNPGDFELTVSNMFLSNSWLAWAPFSVVGSFGNPLPFDWEQSSFNLRVIVLRNLVMVPNSSRDGFLPKMRMEEGAEGSDELLAGTLFHESLHYLARVSHHGEPDAVYRVSEMCFPSHYGKLQKRFWPEVLKTVFNGKGGLRPLTRRDIERVSNTEPYDLDQFYEDF